MLEAEVRLLAEAKKGNTIEEADFRWVTSFCVPENYLIWNIKPKLEHPKNYTFWGLFWIFP